VEKITVRQRSSGGEKVLSLNAAQRRPARGQRMSSAVSSKVKVKGQSEFSATKRSSHGWGCAWGRDAFCSFVEFSVPEWTVRPRV